MTKWFEVRDADGRAIFRVEANYSNQELCFAPSEAWCPAAYRDNVVECLDAAILYLMLPFDTDHDTVYFQAKG